MPLTPDMRRSIDQIRDYLFGGGYPDPVANAAQLSRHPMIRHTGRDAGIQSQGRGTTVMHLASIKHWGGHPVTIPRSGPGKALALALIVIYKYFQARHSGGFALTPRGAGQDSPA